MMKLRGKIVAEIAGEFGGEHQFDRRAEAVADAILAIPEIREALILFGADEPSAEPVAAPQSK